MIADLTRFAEIEAARERIEQALGAVEILVANAGESLTPPGPLEATDEAGWASSWVTGMILDVAGGAVMV